MEKSNTHLLISIKEDNKKVRRIKKKRKKKIKKVKLHAENTLEPDVNSTSLKQKYHDNLTEEQISLLDERKKLIAKVSESKLKDPTILEKRIKIPKNKLQKSKIAKKSKTVKLNDSECAKEKADLVTKRKAEKIAIKEKDNNAREEMEKKAILLATEKKDNNAREEMEKKAILLATEKKEIDIMIGKREKEAIEKSNKKIERRKKKKILREKNKIFKIREQIRASKTEKWAKNLVSLLQTQESEEEEEEKISADIKLHDINGISRKKILLSSKLANMYTYNEALATKTHTIPMQQSVLATVHYIYQRKLVEVTISSTKSFLNEYLPKMGTTKEIKEIKKEYVKLTTAINSCKRNISGFTRYLTREYYSGRKVLRIEISRGRKKKTPCTQEKN